LPARAKSRLDNGCVRHKQEQHEGGSGGVISQKKRQATAGPSLVFADVLELRAQETARRKGERTRDRLKIAAARQLETVGYHDVRVSDINEAAGVSNALFYVYFKNKQEISQEVLTEFLATLRPEGGRESNPAAHPAESIYRGNLGYARVFAANPGLMRCLIQFGDEIPEFGRLWNGFNDEWSERTLKALGRNARLQTGSPDEAYLTVAALGLAVDGLLRMIFVDRNPKAAAAVDGLGANPEALALLLTRIWYRALFCCELDWSPVAA
jgi:AcrR family transcriptional regulator